MQNEATKWITCRSAALFVRMFTCKIKYWFFSSLLLSWSLMPFVHRLSFTSLSFRPPYFIFTTPPRAHELFHSPSIFTEHAKHLEVFPVNKPQTPPDYSFLNLLSSHGSHIWFIPHSRWVALLWRNQTEANSNSLFFLTKSLCLRSPEGWECAHFPTNTEWLILVSSFSSLVANH